MDELIAWIEKHGGQVTPRMLQQKNRKYRSCDSADTALCQLAKQGYGKWLYKPTTKSGGRPTRTFVLNTANKQRGSLLWKTVITCHKVVYNWGDYVIEYDIDTRLFLYDESQYREWEEAETKVFIDMCHKMYMQDKK